MKKTHQFVAFLLSFLIGIACFIGLSVALLPAEPRLPSGNYVSLEEEFIDAIEHYNATGEILVPSGARFSRDSDKITITDIDSGAYVSCTFVLDGTVPVYRYTYSPSTFVPFFVTLVSCLLMLACHDHLLTLFSNRKYKVLNKIKKNASYGDSRRICSNCSKCFKKESCDCLQCPHATECGSCPANDCEVLFKDMLQENIKSKRGNVTPLTSKPSRPLQRNTHTRTENANIRKQENK